MTNPAQQLHALLTKWQSGDRQRSTFAARGGKPEGNLRFWQAHGRAVALLLEIETLLQGLKAADQDVTVFQRYIPRWYRAIFLPRSNWGSAAPDAMVAAADMDQLWSLGQVLNAHKMSDTVTAATAGELVAALNDVEQLVREVDMPDNERFYILGLIVEARQVAADVETFGSAAARKITMELGGAMMVVAGRSGDTSIKRRCGDVALRLLSLVWWRTADRAIKSGVDQIIDQIGSS